MIQKINLIYNNLLNRNLNQSEKIFYSNKIKNKQFNIKNLRYDILNSSEFVKKSLDELKKIYKNLNINIESIEQETILTYLKLMKTGVDLKTINEIILKFNKTNNNDISYESESESELESELKVNDFIINTYNKILDREPTYIEILKFNKYELHELENILIHSKECSDNIDEKVNQMFNSL